MTFDPTAIPDLIGRFHPLLLHFPIGLLAWAAVVELICVYRKRGVPDDGPDSLGFVVPGAAFALLASLSGWLLADPNDPDTALAWHRWLGVSTTLLALVTCGVGIAASRGSRVAGNSYRLSLFLCVPTLMGAGHIGGELKWGDGFVEKGFEKVFFAEAESIVQVPAGTGEDSGSTGAKSSQALAETSIPTELAAVNLFHERIQPLLQKHCVSCHGPEKAKGKLRLDSGDDLHDLTRDFPLVVADKPEESLLLELVLLEADDDDRMPPPDEPGLSAEELADITAWVEAGAPWPESKWPESKELPSQAGPKGPAGMLGLEGPSSDDHEEPEDPVQEEDKPQLTAEEHFLQKVKPLLESRCTECHGEKKQKGGLRLDIPESVFADREFPTVVKGSLEESELILRIHLEDDDDERMPPLGDRLTEAEAGIFEKWILDGAPWTDPLPTEVEATRPAGAPPKPVTIMPGQLPDFPRIKVEDSALLVQVSVALDALKGAGVRTGLISQQDSSHEAVFRLLGSKAGDTEVALLKGLEPVLTRLDLAGTAISGDAISGLWKFRRLRVLNLSETATGDDDLATLASLPELTVLNLFGSKVTDEGLDILREMDQLRRVYLWRSEVTDEAAARLAAARPDLLVDIGKPLPKPDQEEESGEKTGEDPEGD
ncbi:MAG: c-type cytochrome domain-containing protein [Planctomycetota bacterium]